MMPEGPSPHCLPAVRWLPRSACLSARVIRGYLDHRPGSGLAPRPTREMSPAAAQTMPHTCHTRGLPQSVMVPHGPGVLLAGRRLPGVRPGKPGVRAGCQDGGTTRPGRPRRHVMGVQRPMCVAVVVAEGVAIAESDGRRLPVSAAAFDGNGIRVRPGRLGARTQRSRGPCALRHRSAAGWRDEPPGPGLCRSRLDRYRVVTSGLARHG